MSALTFSDIQIKLPDWLHKFPFQKQCYATVEERMQLVITLSQRNVQHHTGGPFAAAVFDMHSHQLLAVGVNVVVTSNISLAHAEMIALTLAQQRIQHFDLGSHPDKQFELVSSAEPCAMCMAALPWSGIRALVCAARDADIRAIGFDEGSKQADWPTQLAENNISVQRDICRKEAVSVLQDYCKNSGLIYNGQLGNGPVKIVDS